MRRIPFFLVLLAGPAMPLAAFAAAEKPPAISLADCDARPSPYMRVECRIILDPAFDPKWRRMTPSEMQDAVDADPCVGFSSLAAEAKCRAGLADTSVEEPPRAP